MGAVKKIEFTVGDLDNNCFRCLQQMADVLMKHNIKILRVAVID